jgi:hypothetical protein
MPLTLLGKKIVDALSFTSEIRGCGLVMEAGASFV